MNQEEELGKEILRSYLSGLTYEEIAEQYGKGKDWVYKAVKKSNLLASKRLTPPTALEALGYGDEIERLYTEELLSSQKIGSQFSVSDFSIRTLLKSRGVKIRKTGYITKYPPLFEGEITSEIEAYSLGLITADGSVSSDGTCGIYLQESDKYILEEINRQLLGSLGTVKLTHTKEVGVSRKEALAYLRFGAKENAKRLERFGIVPNKADYLTNLSPLIPENLYHHYIRGLWDGDGVCSLSRGTLSLGFCAKRAEFVDSFLDALYQRKIISRKRSIANTGGCFQSRWGSRTDIATFYQYIYKDATIYLKRKKEKIEANTSLN